MERVLRYYGDPVLRQRARRVDRFDDQLRDLLASLLATMRRAGGIGLAAPQMGESIAEGTVVKWLKGVGDTIQRDEPLFEISTDKVDAEIPSPAEGVLLEILVPEGETVEINTVVGRIGAQGEQPSASPPAAATTAPASTPTPQVAPTPPAPASPVSPSAPPDAPGGVVRSSPVVQKIAAEHSVDISLIDGTGSGGRVTKKDILAYIAGAAPVAATPTTPAARSAPTAPTAPVTVAAKTFPAGQDEIREPMSVMRRKIAEHMVMSKRTSAHVYSVFEVDMAKVVKQRGALKPEFAAQGVKLTFLPFFMEAVIRGIKEFPVINSSVDGDTIVYKQSVNLGIAVSLENGLIVPVVKHADQMNLLGLSRTAADLAERARSKRLSPDDVQNGTFTITNVGVFGGLYGMPIINQPQVAILGIGTIVKRPVVIDDAIAIRPIVHISLSYDHRIVDGAAASLFLSVVKRELEKPAT
ncbi:MAG: 2-oxo acid dehydrogenase subunit E2 [Candidatus Krumholzibacteriota bacterium]|nr:2-oxo acid dehydrogenase subunit E2 [Candidatus Krumholzibacteriota bacterium]